MPAPYQSGAQAFDVYALDQTTDTTANPAIRWKLPELKLSTHWTVSNKGREFLKNYEDLKQYPYCDDAPNVRVTEWKEKCTTIGWGHLIATKDEWNTDWKHLHDGTTEMTEAQAETAFQKVPVSQHCFDALASLAFNLGESQFASSSILAEVQRSNTPPAITSININSTMRAPSSEQSAHPSGRGVDINRINGMAVRCAHMDFRTHERCIKLTDDQIRNLKNQVKALQDAFWADCRVSQVLGPIINRNRDESPVPQDLVARHRNHIHITVYYEERTCEG